MPEITPFLWFDTRAEEAMNFYVSIFNNSKAGRITSFGSAAKGLGEMLSDRDPARSQRVMKAMLQMDKIDIGGLKRSYAGE